MRKQGEGLVGRGCCALCFTPFMCARPKGHPRVCPCHAPQGTACGFCGVGLFVFLPTNSRVEEITAWLAEKPDTLRSLSTWLAEQRKAA